MNGLNPMVNRSVGKGLQQSESPGSQVHANPKSGSL